MPKRNQPTSAASSLSAEVQRLRLEYERLRLENEHLAESLRLLEGMHAKAVDLYDFARFPLLSVDRSGLIQDINHAAIDLLGSDRAHLVGRALRSFVASSDRQLLGQALARARSDLDGERCEILLARADGQSIRAKLSIKAASAASGLLYVGLLDLGERDDVIAELRRLSESEQIARRESAARGNFIAILSHELRTPLTPVLATSSLMAARQGLPAEVAAAFEMIKRNAAMETRLIDDLLDVTGIVRGKLRVQLQPVDVHEVLTEATDILRQEAAEKHQSIHLELRADCHRANADPARLHQVFLNLLRNAIKFTPQGGHTYVRSWNGGTKLTIEIEDTGIGIRADAISRLFVPFEQLDDSWANRSRGGGLGLGLAICKGLVDLQGGTISVASPGAGKGTRFAVQFETLAASAVATGASEAAGTSDVASVSDVDHPVAPVSPLLVAGKTEGRRPRILLVDDHVDTLASMTEMMTEMGYDVETAESVRSALAVDLGQVDMIVSDIGLPDGTGLDLMRELRAEGKRRPAIALSGFGMESDIQASREAGFDIHLTKPVDFDVFFATIRKLTAGQGAGSNKRF